MFVSSASNFLWNPWNEVPVRVRGVEEKGLVRVTTNLLVSRDKTCWLLLGGSGGKFDVGFASCIYSRTLLHSGSFCSSHENSQTTIFQPLSRRRNIPPDKAHPPSRKSNILRSSPPPPPPPPLLPFFISSNRLTLTLAILMDLRSKLGPKKSRDFLSVLARRGKLLLLAVALYNVPLFHPLLYFFLARQSLTRDYRWQ